MADIVKPAAGDEITTTWGVSVADGLNGITANGNRAGTQAGAAVIAVPAGGSRFDYTLTFPKPFASGPVLVCWALNGAVHLAVGVSLPSAVSGIIGICRRDGATLTASSVTVEWVAVGPLA